MIRNPDVFERALRAAAAVTGVLRRGTTIGLAAGALTAAGCGSKAAPSQPSNSGAVSTPVEASAEAPVDAGPEVTPDCEDDPGYNSKCCQAELEAGRSPMACTPWGPPAPPVYAGEALARRAA